MLMISTAAGQSGFSIDASKYVMSEQSHGGVGAPIEGKIRDLGYVTKRAPPRLDE